MTALGSIRSPDDPRWFGPPFVPSVARGVGSSASLVGKSACRPASARRAAESELRVPSVAHGVGSSATATESGVPIPLPLMPFALIASRRAIQRSTSSPSLNTPAFGVGSNDEDPEPLVWRADVASAYATPARVIPEGGQVSEYGTECPHSRLRSVVSQTPRAGFHVAMGWGTENSSHILDHD